MACLPCGRCGWKLNGAPIYFQSRSANDSAILGFDDFMLPGVPDFDVTLRVGVYITQHQKGRGIVLRLNAQVIEFGVGGAKAFGAVSRLHFFRSHRRQDIYQRGCA
ncbi:MAG: hypothetical protein A3F78_21610 [Burkholderiales bacterium RIFCSPLOWO2_12_FULL_61_40]|nr:MAG: hypothetical protein A3F78_21610 [Burkholderiales bacterium RIFCSPLOWO2_12_FULL_61_40]